MTPIESSPSTPSSSRAEPLVCVVDDEASMRESLCGLLRSAGYAAAAFASGGELLASTAIDDAFCFVLDVCLGQTSGPDLQRRLATSRFARTPTIFMTGHDDKELHASLLAAGASAVLIKPFEDDAILDAVTAAIAAANPT